MTRFVRGVALRLATLIATVVVALLSTSRTAYADVERFAVLVGNDRGDAQDAPLRYAGADADRMRDVLTQMGGFAAGNVVVLRDDNADAVRRALIATNDRVRAAAARPDSQVVLLVYFSGHADGTALHLGTSRLDLKELEQLVRGSAAQFRILLVDACRSGTLTRTKGGAAAPPFAVRLGDELEGQGVVFLTSSAQNEDSQESDELGGSFFTHHFVSGLRGAADTDGDGRVQLDEAYRYAYEATVRATSRTWSGTQHPAYRFELGGQGRVVLTEPGRGAARSLLVFPPGRSYLVFRRSQAGDVVGEVAPHAVARRLFVMPGRYFIRARASDYMLEGTVTIDDQQELLVRDDALHRIEYARLVRKGGADLREVNGPLAGYTLRTALRDSAGLCQGAFAGYAFAFSAFSVMPRIDACRSSFENGPLHATVADYGAGVRLTHVWDFPVISLELGLAGGASWLRQTFSTTGKAPDRNTVAARTSVVGGLDVDLPAGFYLLADAEAETYLFDLEDRSRNASLAPSLAFRAHLGLGKHW